MIIGAYDRKVIIQQPTLESETNTGDVEETGWTTYKTLWARRVPKSSIERQENDQTMLIDMWEYWIRYLDAPAVNDRMRILDDSKYYYIGGIKELDRKHGYVLTVYKRDV